MEAFVERFRAKASKARQAQSRLKALAKLQPIADDQRGGRRSPSVSPIRQKPLAPPIVRIENGSVGYAPGKPVLSRLDLRIDDDDRIALLGTNGNGKSTFAKLIAGALSLPGRQHRSRVEAEDRLLRPAPARASEAGAVGRSTMCATLMPGAPEAQVRSRVARMGLATEKMDDAGARTCRAARRRA